MVKSKYDVGRVLAPVKRPPESAVAVVGFVTGALFGASFVLVLIHLGVMQ